MAATVPTENPIILDLTTTFGGMLIGCFLSCAVWGVSCLQMFYYFAHFPKDSRYLKALVLFIWAADTTNEVLILKPLWKNLISEWGRVAGLQTVKTDLLHHIYVAGTVACLVQCFYLYRMYIYNGRKPFIPLLLAILSSYQIFVAIPIFLIIDKDFTFENLTGHVELSLNISMRACSAAVDIFIAVMMTFYLFQKGTPELSKTKALYYRILLLTINTGAWTALFAIMDFTLMIAFPKDIIYTIFEWPLCPLYLCMMLSNLNARNFLRGSDDVISVSIMTLGDNSRAAQSHQLSRVPRDKTTPMFVNIETSRMGFRDPLQKSIGLESDGTTAVSSAGEV
jgi:hypothetical protein